jgi:hypothetical protein
MKIAIIGTRGIPNYHGGFEQFAEYFAAYLAKIGHEVYVYNSHTHPYQDSMWQGVRIIHKWDPEHLIGTAGQFIYDLNCILDSRSRDFDIILQLGYTSSSIWGWAMPKKPVLITNMDGLEWKRSKYKPFIQRFLKIAEKWAVQRSDYLIADSLGIHSYLKNTYNADTKFIPYGADAFRHPNENELAFFGLKRYSYNMLIARLEPENNIETILDGVSESRSEQPFLVIGKKETKYGKYLLNRYKDTKNIKFLGAIYNHELLNNLRWFSNLYFHGHSVGGTNPSLLEAMASKALIVAHRNVFNESVLGKDAYYFGDANEVSTLMKISKEKNLEKVESNFIKIEQQYSWNCINSEYEEYMIKCLNPGN